MRPTTHWEVEMQQRLANMGLVKMRTAFHNTWIRPMYIHLFRMYNMYEGRKRTDWYWLHIIKTM